MYVIAKHRALRELQLIHSLHSNYAQCPQELLTIHNIEMHSALGQPQTIHYIEIHSALRKLQTIYYMEIHSAPSGNYQQLRTTLKYSALREL